MPLRMNYPAGAGGKSNYGPSSADQTHGRKSFGVPHTMRDRKLSASIIGNKAHRKPLVVVFLILFSLPFGAAPLTANNQKRTHEDHESCENVKAEYHYADRRVKSKGEGNELTGQTAAWLLVGANLTVLISILIKGITRHFALGPGTKDMIKRFNLFQKNHLMRFHYILNPVALCIALFHFLLSTCRRSSIPEWGLILALIMVFLGFMLKFQIMPGWSKRLIYRIHTSPVVFSALILVLLVGHLIVA